MDLARVDQNLIDAYARSLRADRRRLPNVNAQLLEVIVDLYAFRDHLPSGGLRFVPWQGRSPYVVAGYRHKPHENRTPRIPEPIIAPLLAWSLKYIGAFAADIFAARDELTALQMRRAALQTDDALLSSNARCTTSASSPFSMTVGGTGAAYRSGRQPITEWFAGMHTPARSPSRLTCIFSIFMSASTPWSNPRRTSDSLPARPI
jgi:hypothetical protein